MRVIVFNGWAAGPEAWELTSFRRDWTFSYIEQLDGVPERVLEDFDEFILVGFSMGGSSALRMLIKYPEKVKGLVLVSATPCMMERKDEGWRGMSERRFEAFSFGVDLMFGDDPSPVYDRAQLARGLDYLIRTDLRKELEAMPKTTFPVRIFHSIADGIVRPNNAAYLKTIFPQAEVEMIAGSEHTLPVTIPEKIDAAVSAILKEVGDEA